MTSFALELQTQFAGILRYAHVSLPEDGITVTQLLDMLVEIAEARANQMLLGTPDRLYTFKEVQAARDVSEYVCFRCGEQFLTPHQLYTCIREPQVVTAHEGECCLCHQTRGVTHIRHFNYLAMNI